MSRLDSFIRRLEAQRACLNRAAALISGIDGIVLELGLGNGRTYDHLRELFADRDIYVCERRVAAHPDCVPPPEFLILGDMRETLPGLGSRFGGRVALAHFDAGTGDRAANLALAAELTPPSRRCCAAAACWSATRRSRPPGWNCCRCRTGSPQVAIIFTAEISAEDR